MKVNFISGIIILSISLNILAQDNPLPELYKELLPSVVTLHTFQNKMQGNITKITTSPNGLGSGVIISEAGLIVTAAHVVHSADAVQVEFNKGIIKKGRVISSLPWADLALVKVDELPANTQISVLGDSKKVLVGEQVFVIGAPLGLSRTLTVGYISGTHPVGSRPSAPMAEFFQTDAAINPGNSGGPMFNLEGEIIGIASHIQTQSGGNQGLGFTVTSETVRKLILERSMFWSGIEMLPLNKELAKIFQLPQGNGVLIQRVASGSLAQKAGLMGGRIESTLQGKQVMLGGDIILAVNQHEFDSEQSIKDIMDSIKKLKSGSKLNIVVWRRGKKKSIEINMPN